ncbi:hypothetical protein SNK04_008733 [Fusarium graminearum]
MCKHILNAQVAVRSPCCRKWFDCVECHGEQEDHPLKENYEMIFACKKCRKCFRKDTPQAALSVESEDVRMDNKMLRDDRQKTKTKGIRSIFDPSDDADKLG